VFNIFPVIPYCEHRRQRSRRHLPACAKCQDCYYLNLILDGTQRLAEPDYNNHIPLDPSSQSILNQ